MDLASVVAALASVGVRVSGSAPNSSVQVDSSRACPTGLAGPEPSGTINDPGQHFQTNSTQRPGLGHPGSETRESQRQRGQRQRGRGTKERKKKQQKTEHRATKTARQKGLGRKQQSPESSEQRGGTQDEATAQGEQRSGSPTTQTIHSAKAQGTRGRKPEKARDKRGAQKKTTGLWGGGRKEKQTAKSQGTRGRKPKTARDKGGARKREKKKKKKGGGGEGKQGDGNKGPRKGQPQPGGGRAKQKDRAARGKGEVHQNAPGRPAVPTRPGRTSTRTHARNPGVASSDPQGEVSASTRNSPGALAESPVERRTVRETGGVSDRVHTHQPPQRKQPKTDAGGTRQGQPHRRAPNGFDAERAQRPCLGGGQRQAQSARFPAGLCLPRAAAQ